MRQTKLLMGMPITVDIVGASSQKDIEIVFSYFQDIDTRFSTYKKDSEVSLFNRGEIAKKDLSKEYKKILLLSEKTKQDTDGFFNIQKSDGTIDPSGLVKGWAICEASKLLKKKGHKNFSVEAGGDIQVMGKNAKKEKWKIGIKNPFNQEEIVKVVAVTNSGVATSGTYIRGQHVYNPYAPKEKLDKIVSITVIGPNIYEADRFATAVFAMQEKGIYFLERQKDLEGYMIDKNGIATMTSGFENYVC